MYSEIDGKAICRAPSAGRVPFRVGWFAAKKGHCRTVGDGKNSQKQDEEIFMLVARTLPDDSNEEAVDEALDNLSDALEDLFSTCNWDNVQLSQDDHIMRGAMP